ncbi:MAG: chemotaxis protein CheX [Phycisphaeraceae bacterium]|nr:MAG: chemotaxis protein CheX [Phycisphaeraceae bacterium]
MDAGYITPFVKSIQNVFSTMLQLPVTVLDPAIKQGNSPSHDVSGIIGMSGDVKGSVILSFKLDAAESIVALFCGERMDPDHADFADAIGELVNMVCGGAKAMFTDKKRVSISCPSVIVGKDHGVCLPSDVPCVLIPCSTDCGEFVIEVAIRENAAANKAAEQAAANA